MRCPACSQNVALATPTSFVPHFPNQRNTVGGPMVRLCAGVPPQHLRPVPK